MVPLFLGGVLANRSDLIERDCAGTFPEIRERERGRKKEGEREREREREKERKKEKERERKKESKKERGDIEKRETKRERARFKFHLLVFRYTFMVRDSTKT